MLFKINQKRKEQLEKTLKSVIDYEFKYWYEQTIGKRLITH